MDKSFKRAVEGAENNQITIFLDLDGVIADFDTHLHAQNKVDENGKTKWDELDHDWFASIPVYEGARDFYFSLKDLGTVKFLTAPTMSFGCYSGKAEWMKRSFLPEWQEKVLKQFIIAPSEDKQYLAGPTRILVDDREKNIREWEEAGGIGVLHTGDFKATLKAVKDKIASLEQGAPIQTVTTQPRP